jgi:predicted transcriptional regulator
MGILQEKPTQITEEELKELNELKTKKTEFSAYLADVNYRKLQIDDELEFIKYQFKQLQQVESELTSRLTEKYGDTQIDLKTGAIEPIKA